MYKQTLVVLFLILMFFPTSSFCYSWQKCRNKVFDSYGGGSRSLTSSTQFTSSWGPCSAMGKTTEEERAIYFAINWEFIQNDIAKGSGENLSSLLVLSGCEEVNDLPLRKQLKKNFEIIFNKDIEQSYNYISPLLDDYCRNESRKTLTI